MVTARNITAIGLHGRRAWIILLAILIAASGVRLYGLSGESIWLDEATSIWLAKMSVPDAIRWTAVDIHPPLYYIVLHFWLRLGDGEAQVRLLSVLMGVGGVAAVYMLAWRVFNRRVAILSAVLLAFSPLHVWYSQETRMYAMLTFLGLLTSYLMLRALLDGSRLAWVAYTACTILMLYTHYYALFVLLFQNLAAAYLLWHGDIGRKTFGRWLGVQALAVLAFAPWLPVMISQIRSGGGAWVARAGVPDLRDLVGVASLYLLGPDLQWYPPLVRRLTYVAAGVLILSGMLVAWRRGRGLPLGFVFCLTYLAIPVTTSWAVSQVKPLFSQRYLLPFLPPFCMLLAASLDMLRPSGRYLSLAWVPALIFAGLVAVGGFGIMGLATHHQQTDWRGIAADVVSQALPDDVAIFVPGWNWKPFDYYARGRIALQGNIPIPVTPDAVPGLIADTVRGHTRLWLVQAEGHYADPNDVLRSYLDRTYTRLDSRTYGDVIVALYEISP